MKIRIIYLVIFQSLLLFNLSEAQIAEESERTSGERTAIPKVMDLSEIFQLEEMTREDFEVLKREREQNIRERLSQMEALEQAIDPTQYIVGPDDIFSFNVWGAMEIQTLLAVTPEGKLLIPSAGEMDVSGKPLTEVQKSVIEKAAGFYEHSNITLNLEGLRFFRVHVVGEVKFPGTYIAQAVDRISELIVEAGGVTERGWKREIQLRHPDGAVDYFDLTSFEQEGNLEKDLYVNGGDVIYVPPIEIQTNLVQVEGDLEHAGIYQIFEDENLIDFLNRIRALKRSTDLSKIVVIRSGENDGTNSESKHLLSPFSSPFTISDSIDHFFPLRHGDRIVLPSMVVYVKGTVQSPGAYPYILNLTAKDYAGMAGGDYRSGSIKDVRVFHTQTGKTEKGPDVLVEPGDVVHLNPSWNVRLGNYIQILPAITSLILAAKAAGFLGD
ncbi:SLBB domain-containing protein [bacterium]|nr:SLBB domain-containing protein [bacterium]